MKQIYLKFPEDFFNMRDDIDHTVQSSPVQSVQCWPVCQETEAVLVREVRLYGLRTPLSTLLSTGVHSGVHLLYRSPLLTWRESVDIFTSQAVRIIKRRKQPPDLIGCER